MDDAALARRLQEGDAAAWADVYDRYADRLHDYCASILHDRHEAEDALHDAFVTASQRIDQLRDPDRLRPWLYAICRTTALGRARRRSRIVPSEEVGVVTPAPAGPDPVEERDLQRLVWDAAEGLAPQDKAVLYLHLRHGLTGEALGEALEMSPHHANVRLSRVRGLVERSLTVLLVGRVGRRDCPELDALLAGWDGRLDPRLRKRVARHIDGCEVCEERRRTLVSPLGLLAAMPLVPAPPDLRQRVLTSVGAPPREVDPADGAAGGGWRRRLPVVGAVAAAVIAVLALALRPGGSQPDEVAATESTTTTEASTTTTSTLAPTSTTAATSTTTTVVPPVKPARLVVQSGPNDLGATATQATVSFANDGGEPMTWTAGVELPGARAVPAAGTLAPGATARVVVVVDRRGLPEGSFGGSLVLDGRRPANGASAGSARVGITGVVRHAPVISASAADRTFIGVLGPAFCRQSDVRATVADESALLSVVLRWIGGGGASDPSTIPMVLNGGEWVATLGPPTANVDITWWIEATDALGTATRGPGHVLDVQQVC